jgi:16S rRNA (uracil1498-N3)-methyltransferase
MHRFYLPPEECRASLLTLAGSEAHHALHVLRLRQGERVTVLDGAGHEFICDVREQKRHEVLLHVTEKNFIPPFPYEITLLQAIPKGKIIESIIQKATELGTRRIVPLLTERVVVQLDSEAAASKAEKWQQVAIEAIKQSGNPWLPKVEMPITPEASLARHEQSELPLIASLQEKQLTLRAHVRAFVEMRKRLPKTLSIWIGPEGDFTSREVEAVQNAGALPITLGRLVLRVETAATTCLAIMNYELQTSALS